MTEVQAIFDERKVQDCVSNSDRLKAIIKIRSVMKI